MHPRILSPLPLSQSVFVSGPGRGKGNEGKQLGFFFLFFSFYFFLGQGGFGIGYTSGLHSGGTGVWLQDPRLLVCMREIVRSLSLTSWEWIFRPPPPSLPVPERIYNLFSRRARFNSSASPHCCCCCCCCAFTTYVCTIHICVCV